MTFRENWCYCEALLDVYEELTMDIPDEDVMMCYHNLILRYQKEK